MSKRLSDLRLVDPLLTSIVQGMSNEENTYVADTVFPVVPVQTEAGKIAELGKEHFKSFSTLRAIHADSNEMVLPPATLIPWALDEHDIAVPVDYREEAESVFSVEQGAAFTVREILRLAREVRVATLLTTTGNYNNTNYAVPSTKWTASNGDPINDIMTGAEKIRANCGRRPNNILFSAQSWKAFITSDAVLDRIRYSGLGVVTQQTAEALLNMKIQIGDVVKASDAGAISDVWGDNVVIYYQPPAQMRANLYVPSFGFTLQRGAGILIDRYTVNRKVNYIRGTTIETQLFHGNIAGYLLSDTNA